MFGLMHADRCLGWRGKRLTTVGTVRVLGMEGRVTCSRVENTPEMMRPGEVDGAGPVDGKYSDLNIPLFRRWLGLDMERGVEAQWSFSPPAKQLKGKEKWSNKLGRSR